MSPSIERAGNKLDQWIHPSMQRAVITALILGQMARMGVNIDTLTGKAEQVGQQAEQNAVTLASIEATMSNVLERSFETRRKSWTLSNDLARIERKIDELKGHQ